MQPPVLNGKRPHDGRPAKWSFSFTILLTSLAAIGGLVPLIIEYNPLYSPLAMVLIGGIISSTIAARFVTPGAVQALPAEKRRTPSLQVTAWRNPGKR